MTNEEKELLIKDICSRLQHELLINTPRGTFELDTIAGDLISLKDKEGRLSDLLQDTDGKYWFPIVTGNYKPYLRPMSSMTEEEKNEFENLGWRVDELENNEVWAFNHSINSIMKGVDWLIAHYFDFRGLIPMNLALPATEDMYNTK